MVEQSIWMQKVAADPGHSHWYIERFRAMARAGDDLAGEARFVDAMAPRGARILDAGCGPGRLGSYLAAAGVVGVDVDPALIEAAEHDHPGPRWLVGDLAELDLPARGITDPFDVIVSAGNVMTFLAPSTRVLVLSRLRAGRRRPRRDRLRRLPRVRVHRLPQRRGRRRVRPRSAAVQLGPAAVHRGLRVPGRGAAPGLTFRPPRCIARADDGRAAPAWRDLSAQ